MDEKLNIINELIEWNIWQVHAIDMNDIPTKEYTHGEGMAYTKGQFDYGVMIAIKLYSIKKQLEEQT